MPLTLSVAPSPLGGAAVLAVPTTPPGEAGGLPVVGAGADVLTALGVDCDAALARDEAKGEAGEVVTVPVGRDGVETVLLAGIADGSVGALRKAAAVVVRRSKGAESLATTLADGRGAEAVRAVAESLALAAYSFTRKSEPKPAKLASATLVTDDPAAEAAVARARATADAVSFARDLANTPSLEKTPAWFADQAVRQARSRGLEATVWDVDDLRRDGFGGVLAVGRGSARPPRFVRLDYSPRRPRGHVVLVGKGITFDSGGLSLKPNEGMATMKTDMSGGAAVVGAMTALQALQIDVKVTALVPLAENMPGGDATRPGDVITHYGGRTSEVLNTDAEGRLVLADAIAYATTQLRPDVIVDIATLTGAATLGLGKRHGALYATTDRLRQSLAAAADEGGERLWPMPIVDDYRDALDSPVADLRNVADATKHYSGGSIIATLFLREFLTPPGSTDATPPAWAHLDVAGPARADSDEDDVVKGATGFGVRTLLRWLEAGAPA
ncbi:MAG TPA: leucyl aminopeptidase [Mycobacteriales bacterium]|nr:leucyl aminopeptidase [Mycobacteriales bacterium]